MTSTYQLSIETLPYLANLNACYEQFCDLPGFVLLQSADLNRGRFDILTAYPYERLTIALGESSVDDIYARLKAFIELSPSNSTLPFQGGAIGYLSYDLLAESLGIQHQMPAPFECLPILNVGLYDWAIIVDHDLQSVQLMTSSPSKATQDRLKQIRALWTLNASVKQFKLIQEFRPLIEKNEYQNKLEDIHVAIQKGRLYQVNYTQPFIAAYEGAAFAMYRRVIEHNRVPYAAFMSTDDVSVMSFSPERLLLMDKGCVLTSPIKGTVKCSNDADLDKSNIEWLKTSPKNRAENVMIVDLLRNDLGKIAMPGTVKVDNLCQLQSFRGVHHLVSDISAHVASDCHPIDALKAIFPGGSITGAPKREAMLMIGETERYRRGVYCGSIFYLSRHGRFDSNIAIRTVLAAKGTLHLAAGGGIVMDSLWEEEYQECFSKISAIVMAMSCTA